jgi:uncharacterized alpha-E superfamily protein
MMLARVADSLYWIGRYVERAEHISRLSDVMLTATLDQNDAAVAVAQVALASIGGDEDEIEGVGYDACSICGSPVRKPRTRSTTTPRPS